MGLFSHLLAALKAEEVFLFFSLSLSLSLCELCICSVVKLGGTTENRPLMEAEKKRELGSAAEQSVQTFQFETNEKEKHELIDD